MRFLKWTAYGFTSLFVLLLLVGFVLRRSWSKDKDSLSIEDKAYRFQAARDEMGVWKIKAENENSLFFAMGYVQGLDREFQVNALNYLSQGRGTEVFGQTFLKFDRLRRLSFRVAESDFTKLENDSLEKRAAQAFADGFNKYQNESDLPEPVEYRFLGMHRRDVERLSALSVFAIMRFHTWDFSFDHHEEFRAEQLRREWGESWQKILLPEEPADSLALQQQSRDIRSSALDSNLKINLGKPFFETLASQKVAQSALPSSFSKLFFNLDSLAFLSEDYEKGLPRGASNAWLMADPKTGLGPTLCNDTHLSFHWPSALYPLRYEVDSSVKGTGFALPGMPALVIGDVSSVKHQSQMTWGITMASFADTQDFVEPSPETLEKAREREEIFNIRNPQTGETTRQKFRETWTPWGPLVTDLFDSLNEKKNTPVAMDWMGFREMPTPFRFFLNRTLAAGENLSQDLAVSWTYPAVNFTWIRKQGENSPEAGSAVTGLLWSQKNRGWRRFLTEKEAALRSISQPGQRPVLKWTPASDQSFLVVSTNQKTYESTLARQISHDWIDGRRGARILDQALKNSQNPETMQTDFYVPTLVDFWKSSRGLLGVSRICARGTDSERDDCQRHVALLDAWNGIALEKSVEPMWISLAFSLAKDRLWPNQKPENSEALKKFMRSWHRASVSDRALMELFSNSQRREEFESQRKIKFSDLLTEAYRDAFEMLYKNFGPPTAWSWGLFHVLDWQHPLGKLPAPLGPVLKDSLLGPPPAVPGGWDSPGRFEISWDPEKPFSMKSAHGAVMRFCRSYAFKDQSLAESSYENMRWTNITGPSGNPFSKWSRHFPEETYFKNKLYEAK